MAHASGFIATAAAFILQAALLAVEAKSGKAEALIEEDRKEGVRPCDWLEFRAKAEGEELHLAYQCADAIDFSRGAAYCIYIDVDGKRHTGFRGSEDNFPIGADYLLQASILYRYTGGGTAWSWSAILEVTHKVHGERAEFVLPVNQLGADDDTIRVFLIGDNTAVGVGGDRIDELPDGALRRGGGGKSIRIKMR
jgi:hypothetical protein